MRRILCFCIMALACLHGGQARAAPAAAALVGDWYNTDYGVYPEFAVLSLTADGHAAITGLVRSVLGVRTVLPRISGPGARGCGGAVLAELRRVGWRIAGRADQADAILEVHLSAIQYKYSAWVGRYYKMRYATKVRRAGDGYVLAVFDGAERAAGQGPYETCRDTADDIVDDIEDLIDDLRG
jgi:hypothetical protein